MAHKFKRSKNLWQRHEDIYQKLFMDALSELKIMNAVSLSEDAISEKLSIALQKLCYGTGYEIIQPVWEKQIQPLSESEEKGGKTNKRPDFTCVLLDSTAKFENSQIPLHVECKLLGKKNNSWALCKKYVIKGMCRFDSPEHEYGKRASSGIMIGYIINSASEEIQQKINSHIKAPFSQLGISLRQKIGSTTQSINRKSVLPQKFSLFHIWRDFA